MTRAAVVIGAAFGDEGKGLLTDYAAWRSGGANSIVVRFNGGAQAGHTVVTPEGKRHVFGHIGAGALAGATTFLSQFFIVNPIMFAGEMLKLQSLGVKPRVVIDPRAMLSTPYDMLLNQAVEHKRGTARHGSCGLGINETVTRCLAGYETTADDLWDEPRHHEKLLRIETEWVPRRIKELGLEGTASEETNALNMLLHPAAMRHILVGYHAAITGMLYDISMKTAAVAIGGHDGGIVFEGAQGLLLDENHFFFPHVTRSRTGLTNVIKIAREAGIFELEVTYAMRAYMTRHGAGPFPTEDPAMSYPDATNQPNPWQQTLRFGTLDIDHIKEAITADLYAAREKNIAHIATNIAMTCVDQVDDLVRYRSDGRDLVATVDKAVDDISKTLGFTRKPLKSVGPTRNNIAFVRKS